MAGRRWLLTVSVAVALLAAGCAGAVPEDAGQPSDTPDPAPPAEGVTDGGAGFQNAVRGVVVDDEQLPLSDALVALQATNLRARTATDGSFALTAIPAGTYLLSASADGWRTVTLRIEVPELGDAWQNFTLEPAPPTVRYVDWFSRTIFIDVAESESNYGAASKANMTCRECKLPIWLGEDAQQLRVEFDYEPAFDWPNHEEVVFFSAYWNTTVDGPFFQTGIHPELYLGRGSAAPGGNVTYTAPVDIRGTHGVLTLYMDGDRFYPMINQRIDLYVSTAYHGVLPAGWSRLPEADSP